MWDYTQSLGSLSHAAMRVTGVPVLRSTSGARNSCWSHLEIWNCQGASRCIKVHQGAWDHTLNQGTEATPEIASWLEWSRLQPTAVNSCTRLQCAFPHRTINHAARRFIARVWTISLYVIVVRPMIWRTAASSVKMNTVMLSVLQQMLGKWEQWGTRQVWCPWTCQS